LVVQCVALVSVWGNSFVADLTLRIWQIESARRAKVLRICISTQPILCVIDAIVHLVNIINPAVVLYISGLGAMIVAYLLLEVPPQEVGYWKHLKQLVDFFRSLFTI
jgi:hypothetical protein